MDLFLPEGILQFQWNGTEVYPSGGGTGTCTSMNRLLLETDSPYLSLTTSRKGNSPLYIGDIASLIAGIKGVSIEVVRGWTVENGKRIFQLGL